MPTRYRHSRPWSPTRLWGDPSDNSAGLYSDQLRHVFSKWSGGSTGSSDLDDFILTIGEMFDIYEPYIGDRQDGTPGWGTILDVDIAPGEGLPYLAQYVGERLPMGISEDDARDWIRHTPNQLRGTKRGIAKAAQRTLTDSKTVLLHPRHKLDGTPDPDFLTVLTQDVETPDPDRVIGDILSAMPAYIELNYDHPTGVIWETVAGLGTWADVEAEGTWADVAAGSLTITTAGWYVFTGADLSPWA